MTMTLDEFRNAVRVLPEAEADDRRRRFREAFLVPGAEDAPMWRALRRRQRVSLARLWATVAAVEEVTVLWDRPDTSGAPLACRAFADDDVLECSVVDLERGVDWLPDDLYVFDHTLRWSAVFTPEADIDGMIVLLAEGTTDGRSAVA